MTGAGSKSGMILLQFRQELPLLHDLQAGLRSHPVHARVEVGAYEYADLDAASSRVRCRPARVSASTIRSGFTVICQPDCTLARKLSGS